MRTIWLALIVLLGLPSNIFADEKVTVKVMLGYEYEDYDDCEEGGSYYYYNKDALNSLLTPGDIKRQYFIQYDRYDGKESGEPSEVTQEKFYEQVKYILVKGISSNFNFNETEFFRGFLKALIDYQILDKEGAKKLGEYYVEQVGIEPAYFLDEAMPGSLTDKDWASLQGHAQSVYTQVLTQIKQVRIENKENSLTKIRQWVDNAFLNMHDPFDSTTPQGRFAYFAPSYSELFNKGADLPDEVQAQLFSAYLKDYLNFKRDIKKIYSSIGLPIPSNEIANQALIKNFDFLEQGIVQNLKILKSVGYDPPKEYAAKARDILLGQGDNDLRDIEYLDRLAAEPVPPAIWKAFADHQLWIYESFRGSETKKEAPFPAKYYFHQAVSVYLRVYKFLKTELEKDIKRTLEEKRELLKLGLTDEQRTTFLGALKNDKNIEPADMAMAYAVCGMNPEQYLQQFDERLRLYQNPRDARAGAYFVTKANPVNQKFEDTSDVFWIEAPFVPDIQLEAFLNNPERTNALALRIRDYLLDKLEKEGPEIVKRGPLIKRGLEDSETPVYADIKEILKIYEESDFKAGASVLAVYLHEAGWYLPARQAYQISDPETAKFMEEKFFSQKTDDYWQKEQNRFNVAVRNRGIEKATQDSRH